MRLNILLEAINTNQNRCKCTSFYHVCIAFRGGKILAKGMNCCCKSTSKYGHVSSRHAEIDVLEQMQNEKKNFDMLVVRLDRQGTKMHDSRPCRRCEHWIKNYPINRIFFSKEDGSINCIFRSQIPKKLNMKEKYNNLKSKKIKINKMKLLKMK